MAPPNTCVNSSMSIVGSAMAITSASGVRRVCSTLRPTKVVKTAMRRGGGTRPPDANPAVAVGAVSVVMGSSLRAGERGLAVGCRGCGGGRGARDGEEHVVEAGGAQGDGCGIRLCEPIVCEPLERTPEA